MFNFFQNILTFYFTFYIDPTQITVKVINGLYAGVTTVELDNLAAEIAATIPQRLLNTPTMPSLLQGISQLFKF